MHGELPGATALAGDRGTHDRPLERTTAPRLRESLGQPLLEEGGHPDVGWRTIPALHGDRPTILRTAPMPRTTTRRVQGLLGLAALVGLDWGGAARAQTSDPEARPTRGVHVAAAARAGDADPTAVQENPAQLGLLPAGGLAVAADLWRAAAPLPGRGAGLFAATPVFARGGLGFGLSRVAASPRLGVDGHTTMQLGYGLGLGRSVALGASWVHVWGSRFGGTDTFDLAASARAGRHAALGLVVEDVGAPRPAPALPGLARLWAGELVVRPLGTERLELSAAATHVEGEQWRWIAPRARVAATVASGLRL